MGNACVENKQVAEEVSETIEHHGSKAADVTQAAKDAAEAAQRAAAQVAKDIDEKGIAQAAQEAAKAAADAAASAAAAALDAAKVAAKEVAEVTGVMIVEFVNEKGTIQKVDFKTKKIGITFGLGGGGCCGPTGPAKVVVKSVGKASQAETLGVKSKWSIKAVNGVLVTGFQQAEKLLREGADKLSEA